MTFLNAQSVVGGQIANKEWQLYTVLLQLIPSCANQIKLVGKWSKMYPNASYAWPWCCVPSYCWRRRNSLINWGQKVKPQRTMGWLVAVGESQNIVLIHIPSNNTQAMCINPCLTAGMFKYQKVLSSDSSRDPNAAIRRKVMDVLDRLGLVSNSK